MYHKEVCQMPQHFGGPYRFRTWMRSNLPWFLIDLGVATKGLDCEQAGGSHEWYNINGKESGCYHCKVVREDSSQLSKGICQHR